MSDEVPQVHSPSPKKSNNTVATPDFQSTLIDLEVGSGAYTNPVLGNHYHTLLFFKAQIL